MSSATCTTQAVWSIWSDLDNGNFNFNATQGATMMNNGAHAQASSGLALNASIGYGNYNGGFITLIDPELARVADA